MWHGQWGHLGPTPPARLHATLHTVGALRRANWSLSYAAPSARPLRLQYSGVGAPPCLETGCGCAGL
jgi:hypothetical protein